MEKTTREYLLTLVPDTTPRDENKKINFDEVEPNEILLESIFNGSDDPLLKSETQLRVRGTDRYRVEKMRETLSKGSEIDEPICLVISEDGKKVWIADGHHTLSAYSEEGRETIKAKIVRGNGKDARLYATGANFKHGLPRTKEDEINSIRVLLTDFSEWKRRSNNSVAEFTNTSAYLVKKVKEELGVAKVDKVIGKDGKTRNVKNTGKGATGRPKKKAEEKEIENNDVVIKLPSEDSLGNILPEYLQEVFGFADSVDSGLTEIGKAKARLHKLIMDYVENSEREGFASPIIDAWKEANKAINKIMREVKAELPVAISPYCKGKYPHPTPETLCPITGDAARGINRGWVNKEQYKDSPEELTKTLKDAWEIGYWNNQVRRTKGITAKELLNKEFPELQTIDNETGEDTDTSEVELRDVIINGETYSLEVNEWYDSPTEEGFELMVDESGNVSKREVIN